MRFLVPNHAFAGFASKTGYLDPLAEGAAAWFEWRNVTGCEKVLLRVLALHERSFRAQAEYVQDFYARNRNYGFG